MLIRVTPDHVRRGRRCHAGSCPYALAIADVLPPGAHVNVSREYVSLWRPGDRRTHLLGLSFHSGEAVARYDLEGVMEPHAFELDLASVPWAKGATS